MCTQLATTRSLVAKYSCNSAVLAPSLCSHSISLVNLFLIKSGLKGDEAKPLGQHSHNTGVSLDVPF